MFRKAVITLAFAALLSPWAKGAAVESSTPVSNMPRIQSGPTQGGNERPEAGFDNREVRGSAPENRLPERKDPSTSVLNNNASTEGVGEISPEYKEDCALMVKLQPPRGWVASGIKTFRAEDGCMLTEDSHKVLDAGGHPADLLMEFGCTHLVGRQFKRGQRVCSLNLYRFSNACGAFSAYSNLRIGASTVLTRGDGSSEDEDSISFWSGPHFVSLSTTAIGDDEAKEAITALANAISSQLQRTGEKPPLLKRLPGLEKVHGSERYYLGPIAARVHVALPYLNLLSLFRCQGSISADYQYPQPYSERLKLLLIDYGKTTTARSVFDAYSAGMRAVNKVVEDSDSHFLCKVNNSFLLCSRNGAEVSVIWGARKKYAPAMLARQLGRLDAAASTATE